MRRAWRKANCWYRSCGLRSSVVFKYGGRWSEALQHRLRGDLGDVVEHLAVLRDSFKLLRLDGKEGVALEFTSAHTHADPANVLPRQHPTLLPRRIVETEQLVARNDLQ